MFPESVLQSPALKTAPHAAFRILAVLLCGKSRERNGTMMCSERYAARFGINSRETVRRSLAELEARGLIERTRRVTAFSKHATLWAVTWWDIAFRDNVALDRPEPASHKYRSWNITPAASVNAENPSHLLRDNLTPVASVEEPPHHTHGERPTPNHHTCYRPNLNILGGGTAVQHQLAEARMADLMAVARSNPKIEASELARTCRTSEQDARHVLQRVHSEAAA